jgi:Zn-dependent peptidase ImmA (M78 family)
MGVKVLRPDELSLPREHGKELGEDGSSHWSALTVKVASGYVIIYNPTHTPVRINNSLCHELSHIILDHNHSELHRAFGTVLRDFHPELESQANRLASILLVPSPAVQLAKTNGGSVESLARDFVVSEDLARWRWNMVR